MDCGNVGCECIVAHPASVVNRNANRAELWARRWAQAGEARRYPALAAEDERKAKTG
jgi:hypothetical protein